MHDYSLAFCNNLMNPFAMEAHALRASSFPPPMLSKMQMRSKEQGARSKEKGKR
jgi:hypothetical protein